MTESDGQGETQAIWRERGNQNVSINANSSETFGKNRPEERFEVAKSTTREDCSRGNCFKNTLGGILDQLIEDARQQLGKARESAIRYQNEAKEYEKRLQNLLELKKLEQQQTQLEEDGENETQP